MHKATISQLKNNLSAYLRKVRAGGTVLILDRDEPIARLVGVVSTGRDEDKLARLEKAGIIRRALEPLDLDVLRAGPPPSASAGASLLEALLQERRDGR